MTGEDRDLVLYLDSPDGDYWTGFLEEKGYESWGALLRDHGFSDGQYEIKSIEEYEGFKDVDVVLEWELSDGGKMQAPGRSRVVDEALEHLDPEKQDLDEFSEEDADPYMKNRSRGYM